MKSWLNIPQKNGAVYALPVEAIINHRAAVCWAQDTGDRKFPVVRDETIATFEADPDAIASWVTLNMPWVEIEKHFRVRTASDDGHPLTSDDLQDALLGQYGMLELDDKAPGTSDLAIIDDPVARPPFNFRALMLDMGGWSYTTFGHGPRTGALIEHARRELLEIEARPFDLIEWLDLAFLALDGARRHTQELAGPESLEEACDKIEAAMTGKFEVLKSRSYPAPDPAGEVPTEHIDRSTLGGGGSAARGGSETGVTIIPRPSAHH